MKILHDYSRSVITKYLRAIKGFKTLLVESSLIHMFEKLLGSYGGKEDRYFEGLAEFYPDHVSH